MKRIFNQRWRRLGHSFPGFSSRGLRVTAFRGQFLSIACLCVTLVIGCQSIPSSTPSNSADSGRITIGTTLKPRTLDPADCYELAGLNIIYNVGESLYTYKLGTTELQPLLAAELPEISQDGLIYTITLKEGITFHDGAPFNAEAMKFSLDRFSQNGGKPSFLLTETVDSVEATGDYEITIKLKKPFAAFPSLLAFPGTAAVSPQAYQIGSGQFNPNELIGTGPYQLAKFSSDSIRLDAFAGYWGETPANSGIDIPTYAGNSANLYNSFRTGAVDIAYHSLDSNQISSLLEGASQGKWQAIESAGTVVNYLVLNLKQEPLDRPEVRQAIAALIDRSLLNERVLQGQGEPVYSLVPTALEVYKPTFQEAYGEANIEKAKQLLTQAGYSTDNPAIIEIWHTSGSIARSIAAATLQAYAERELGGMLQFKPNSVESASFFSHLSKGIYPTALVDWYPDFLDADNYIQPFLECTQGTKATGCEAGSAQSRGSSYYSDRANQLIDQQRQAQDAEAREQIFAELQEILARDVPYIPLWQSKDYVFAQRGIKGVIINPSQNFPFWNLQN